MLGALPVEAALALGRFAGSLAHLLALRPRRLAKDQLSRRLALSPNAATALAKRSFQTTGESIAELAVAEYLRAHTKTGAQGNVLDPLIGFPDGAKRQLEATLAEDHGAIVVTGHIGNWELLAQRVASEGYDVATLARSHPNPFIGEWLVSRRERAGVETIDRKDPKAARKILAAIRRKAILGILIDQDTSVRSTFVPFFGELAKTPTAAAELALKRRIPVLVAYSARSTKGREVRVRRVPLDGLPDDFDQAVIALTAKLTAMLEEAIREDPAAWVWYHDRWRSRPDPVEKLIERGATNSTSRG